MLKRIDANLIYNAMYQLLLILVPILTTPFLARTLGPTSLGTYGYVAAIVAFLGNFMLLGLNQFGVRTIAKSNKNNLVSNFRDLWGTQIIAGVVLLSWYLLFVAIFAPYKIFFLLEIPFLIGYGTDISWLYIGVGKVKRVVIRNSIIKLISVIFIFVLIRNQHDLWKYFLINSLGILFANMIFLVDINRIGIQIKKLHWRKYSFRFLSSLLFLAVPLVASQLYTNIDSALVGTFAGTHQLAFYDQSQKIARVVLAALTSTSTVIMPKMAGLDGNKNQDRLYKLFRLSLDLTLVISLTFALLMMVNTYNFIPFFFGNSFNPMRLNMYWVSLIVVFISYGSVFSLQLALAKGLYQIYMIPYVVGAIYSLIANTIFDNKYGSIGGTWVIVTTELLVCFLRVYMIRGYVNLREIFNRHYKTVLAFVATLIIFNFFNFNNFNLYLSFVLNSISAIACFVCLMFLMRDHSIVRLLRLFKSTKEVF